MRASNKFSPQHLKAFVMGHLQVGIFHLTNARCQIYKRKLLAFRSDDKEVLVPGEVDSLKGYHIQQLFTAVWFIYTGDNVSMRIVASCHAFVFRQA